MGRVVSTQSTWGGTNNAGTVKQKTNVKYVKGSASDLRNQFTSSESLSTNQVMFGAWNNEKAAHAFCPVASSARNQEHYCIGGGGYWPEGAPKQCTDFPGFDWSGKRTGTQGRNGWSASGRATESTVFFFYKES